MKRGTAAVAAGLVRASLALVTERTGGAPVVVRPVRMRLPTWDCEMEALLADDSPVTAPPTMNSWPIRCAAVIRLNTVWAAVSALELALTDVTIRSLVTAAAAAVGVAMAPEPARDAQSEATRKESRNRYITASGEPTKHRSPKHKSLKCSSRKRKSP
jgi:hypothetical protein